MGISTDYSAPPTPHVLGRDWFLPIKDMPFGGKDYRLEQPEKTLANVNVLQYWVERAQPPHPDIPCQLVEGVWELCQAMEPLATFMNAEVLGDNPPSNW